VLWLDKPSWFNYESVIDSLESFVKNNPLPDGKKYVIILDNAPWHKKAARIIGENESGRFDELNSKIELLNLPPYSPDLNPIEQVWRITRKEKTHNRYFSNLATLESTIDDYFDRFKVPNDKLKNLCNFSSYEGISIVA